MPSAQIKDEKTYQALRREGNSEEKSARIANAAAGALTLTPASYVMPEWAKSRDGRLYAAPEADPFQEDTDVYA